MTPASEPTAKPVPPAPLVLVYTDDPCRGGVAQYNHTLLLALVAAGYRTLCVQSRGESPLIEAQRAAGVRHLWLPYDTAAAFVRTMTDTATPDAIFERERPDLVIFSDCSPVSNIAARQVALGRGIPYVVVVGFVAPYLAVRFASTLGVLARQYAQACQVIAVSQENLQLLRAHFGLGAGKGEVIHYGRPAAFFAPADAPTRARLRQELGIPARALVALTTARLTPVKGYYFQLSAIASLVASGEPMPDYFLWLGEGELGAPLTAEIRRRGLQDRIKLLGHRWDTPAWYDAADLYVLPSEFEGMPLAIMEAMAKGLPVAASAVSGIPEELGPTGRLLPDPKKQPAEAVQALARALSDWTRSPAERRRVGRDCQRRAQELFREELMIERTLKIIVRQLPAPGAPLGAAPAHPIRKIA